MAFIGFIVERKNEMQIKRILEKGLNSGHKQYTIIAINNKNIENIKNIKFETLVIFCLDEITNKRGINEILKSLKFLIISSDIDSSIVKIDNNIKINVITFGFNQKATITASSVEDGLIVCIQRKIININENILEPQEIEVKTISKKSPKSTHNLIGIASTLLVYSKKEIKI